MAVKATGTEAASSSKVVGKKAAFKPTHRGSAKPQTAVPKVSTACQQTWKKASIDRPFVLNALARATEIATLVANAKRFDDV